MPYMPWFPEPGSYIRYYDPADQRIKYRRLTWRRDPLTYPRRLPQLAAGVKGDTVTLDEVNPSETKKHIYLTYLGVKPGFLFYLWHPYDIKNLKWDEDITDIDEDLVAKVDYESSPYEFPTKAIGIQHDRYPAIQARNITNVTRTPEMVLVAAMYRVVEHNDLSDDERSKLESGAIRSHPWDFGGEL